MRRKGERSVSGPGPATLWVGALGVAALLGAGCARGRSLDVSPHETLLAIVNEYTLFRGTDLYRRAFPEDLTGQNVARATLVRLANYEDLYPGRFTPEIEMVRGEVLADLGDYAGARTHFRKCADYDTGLRPKAVESAEMAGQLDALVSQTMNMETLESHLGDRDRQVSGFQAFADRNRGTRWESLARIEKESAEIARAELLDANQFAIPGGADRARVAFEQLVQEHAESRRGLSHALRLARFHLDQAQLLERLQDPERGNLDMSAFTSHMELALDILHRVSQADGHAEKVVARHQLDEALAYYDLVRARAR